MEKIKLTKSDAIAQIIDDLIEAGDIEELFYDVMMGTEKPVHQWKVSAMKDHFEYIHDQELTIIKE